jgi:hypothetical protein
MIIKPYSNNIPANIGCKDVKKLTYVAGGDVE